MNEHRLLSGDKFLIVGSDGLWEFMTSSEVVDIVKNFYELNDPAGCCEYLLQEASERWLKEEKSIDDITISLIFFN